MCALWLAVKAYFEFTGRNGDGDLEDDGDSYIKRRLWSMTDAKQRDYAGKLNPRIVRQWEEGENCMKLFRNGQYSPFCAAAFLTFFCSFGKNPAVVRKAHHHSGCLSLPPAQLDPKWSKSDSDSDQELDGRASAATVAGKPSSSKVATPNSKKSGVPEALYLSPLAGT